jgi:hypothetical protein
MLASKTRHVFGEDEFKLAKRVLGFMEETGENRARMSKIFNSRTDKSVTRENGEELTA